MTVTAIEPKKKGLCALYIDGEFAFKVDTETVLFIRDHQSEITEFNSRLYDRMCSCQDLYFT